MPLSAADAGNVADAVASEKRKIAALPVMEPPSIMLKDED
jgi:hypothetical protein